MTRIFESLYKYFSGHKGIMWALLTVLSVLSIYFGSKVEYEEDITKLLPASATADSGLAFGNLKVKDKIFIQITSATDSLLDTYTLSSYADEFMDSLLVRDTAFHCIDNVFYRIDDDLPLNAMDFALSHVPSFVDTSCYAEFAKRLTPHAVDSLMALDYDIIMEDETGMGVQMAANDPLSLRTDLAASIPMLGGLAGGKKDAGSSVGFTVIDSHLFCSDSTVALAFVSPAVTAFDTKASSRLVSEIEAQVNEFMQQHPDAQVLFHGAPVRSYGNTKCVKSDLAVTVGISLLIILIVLCLTFKSWSFIPMNVVPAAFGAFFSLACIFFLKGRMSLMSLGIGSIILGVAISYILHILTHFKYVGNSEKVLRDEATPVCLGCITTIGAFLGLLFTESEMLKDFGIFASIALVASTLFGLVFLPHFLKQGDTKKCERAFRLIGKINELPYDSNRWLIGAVIVMIVVGVTFAHRVEFDTNLKNIGYVSPETLRSEALYAEKNMGNDVQVIFAAAGNSLDEALQCNKALANVCDSMQAAGMVKGYSPMSSVLFVSEPEQEARIEAWNKFWNTPDASGATRTDSVMKLISASAKKHNLDPSMFESFRAMLEDTYSPESLYDAQILPAGLQTSLVEKMDDGRYLVFTPVRVSKEERAAVSNRLAELPRIIVADPFFYTSNMVSIIHDDFNVILMISSLFVLLVLLLSFRNIMVALIAFMPMFFSWYVVEGVMAICGLQFNLINIVISTFIFGIGVDYSIFVMEGLLSEARNGNRDLLESHKTAIFLSAFVLMVVVIALLFAVHPSIHSIGVSTLIGMTATILITYTLEPFFFRQLMKWSRFRDSVSRKRA